MIECCNGAEGGSFLRIQYTLWYVVCYFAEDGNWDKEDPTEAGY